MKTIIPFFFLFLSTNMMAQENYLIEWDDHSTFNIVGGFPTPNPLGWPNGSTTHSITETDGNASSVTTNFAITGSTQYLVNKSPAYQLPFVSDIFYADNSLVTGIELENWNESTDEVCVELTFSEGVQNLNFTLYDIDSNTSTEPGADRDEVVTITGSFFGTNVNPTLTGSSQNTISGNTATGVGQAGETSTDGNVAVSFGSAVNKVEICFSIININGTPSANTEPGFGLGNISFTTPLVALPISLSYFDVHANNNDATLEWETNSESNNSYFEIEVALDGYQFISVGEENSKAINGNSTEKINYSFTDKSAIYRGETLYYRIKQVDFDGQYSYTPIRVISFENKSFESKISPNPVYQGQTILIQANGIQTIDIYNIEGQLVKSITEVNPVRSTSLSTDGLTSGTYIVTINHQKSLKLIIR